MKEFATHLLAITFPNYSTMLLTVLLSMALGSGLAIPGSHAADLKVIPDDNPANESVSGNKRRSSPTGEAEPPGDLAHRKEEALSLVDPPLREEERRMAEIIQIMDRDSAASWLSSFISMQPLNCSQKHQDAWVQGILDAVERNRIPICKEILGLVATLISIESSFRVDPLVGRPGTSESMPRLLERAENEFVERFGPFLEMPPVQKAYVAYREKYHSRLAACRTEGEVDALARTIAEDLKRDSVGFPVLIQKVIHKELGKLSLVVRTKGSMQLNFSLAREIMKKRGEQFTDAELTDYMYTLVGGIDVGVAALKPMFVQYAACYGKPDDRSWLFFVGMDYHYGPFSSRNMMEQIRVRDLSGQKIAIDGDFLHYDDKGRPADRESATAKATASIFPHLERSAIVSAFLLEKDPHYIYTNLHRAILEAHRERFGETPFAVIGELWMGHNAQLKHGSIWQTRSYLNKLDRYLNSLPWDRNPQ